MMERKRSKGTTNKRLKARNVFSARKKGISREIAQNSRTRKGNKMELLLLLRKRGMSQQEYVWLQSMCKKVPVF